MAVSLINIICNMYVLSLAIQCFGAIDWAPGSAYDL